MSDRRRFVSRSAALLLSASTLWLLPAAATPPLGDPTAPLQRSERSSEGRPAAPSWRLQSVLIGPDRRIAVINGTVVREGSRIDGATVVAIDDAAVLLDDGARRLHLRLFAAYPAPDDPRGNQ